MSMNISLRQLRAFLAVARQRHFRRAAEHLHLSQPAVSRHIAELESELGVRLFDRNTREVVPTEAGRYLESAIERVLDELEGVLATSTPKASANARQGARRGGAHVVGGLMPTCIADCARDYPELTMQLHDQAQTLVLDSVRGGEVDFGIAIDPPESGEFDCETIMRDPFCLACRPDHPFAKLKTMPWEETAGTAADSARLLIRQSPFIDATLRKYNVEAHVVQQTGHTHTAFRMVEAGLGITITPAFPRRPHRLRCVRLTPTEQRTVMLIHRRHRSLSPLAALVWNRLRELAEKGSLTSY
jgi:DNA-binding transcriptional LysR family regulator